MTSKLLAPGTDPALVHPAVGDSPDRRVPLGLHNGVVRNQECRGADLKVAGDIDIHPRLEDPAPSSMPDANAHDLGLDASHLLRLRHGLDDADVAAKDAPGKGVCRHTDFLTRAHAVQVHVVHLGDDPRARVGDNGEYGRAGGNRLAGFNALAGDVAIEGSAQIGLVEECRRGAGRGTSAFRGGAGRVGLGDERAETSRAAAADSTRAWAARSRARAAAISSLRAPSRTSRSWSRAHCTACSASSRRARAPRTSSSWARTSASPDFASAACASAARSSARAASISSARVPDRSRTAWARAASTCAFAAASRACAVSNCCRATAPEVTRSRMPAIFWVARR